LQKYWRNSGYKLDPKFDNFEKKRLREAFLEYLKETLKRS
jgi:hypothetical protein